MNLLAMIAGVLLLAGNAFFVGAEFALISARRDRIEPLAEQGDKRAESVLRQLEHLSAMLAATQLGITLCSLALGAVAELAVARLLEGGLNTLGVATAAQHVIAFFVALSVVVSLHMVLGEMVPKNLAIAGPERAARWLGPPLFAFARLTRPFIVFLNGFANVVLRLLRVEPSDELASAYTPGELRTLIGHSRREGLLPEWEHELLTHALELSDRTTRSATIPLADVVSVPWHITAAGLEEVVARTGYSRLPVRAPEQDAAGDRSTGAGSSGAPPSASAPELVGFLHAKDVLGVPPAARDRPLPLSHIRPMVTIWADLPLDEALQLMQRARSHLSRVVDAGGTIGVIAMEDVVEALVGEAAETV